MSVNDGGDKGPTLKDLLATLTELGVLNSVMRAKMNDLQTEIDEMKIELAELKAKVHRLEG